MDPTNWPTVGRVCEGVGVFVSIMAPKCPWLKGARIAGAGLYFARRCAEEGGGSGAESLWSEAEDKVAAGLVSEMERQDFKGTFGMLSTAQQLSQDPAWKRRMASELVAAGGFGSDQARLNELASALSYANTIIIPVLKR